MWRARAHRLVAGARQRVGEAVGRRLLVGAEDPVAQVGVPDAQAEEREHEQDADDVVHDDSSHRSRRGV
jgi:hypothetical protein